MNIPYNYEVLFMHGGGSGQFAAVPLNLGGRGEKGADYLITGSWSAKASEEASKYLKVNPVFPVKKPFITIPDQSEWQGNPDVAYRYYCANETVHGVEFQQSPPSDIDDVPLVADISSNILSRPFDVAKHGLIFAGVQKNLGAAGVTVVIVKKELIGNEHPHTPAVLSYDEMHKNNSVYNTPSVFGVYITKLVLEWIRDSGGVSALYERNQKKSRMIYDLIDSSNGFYTCPVDRRYRSQMNIPFRLRGGDERLEKLFLEGASSKGMISLKGHRSVGGIRASLYNAVTVEECQALADHMQQFFEANEDK